MSDFWSRRRASVEAEEAAHERAGAEAQGEALEAGTDAEICEALGLPDPDRLGPEDDVSAFMARAVPQRLRRRALRALWARDPRLANLDGLIDYGQDFTDAGMKAGTVATIYEVGRGLVRRMDAEPAGEEPVRMATGVRPPAEPVARGLPEPAEAAGPADDAPPEAEPASEEPSAPPRRRMRFTFAEDAA